MYWNLFLLAVIVVFVVDISGIMDTLKGAISRWLHVKVEHLKPFDCSLCMVWWSGLLYLLITGRLSIASVAYLAIIAACSVQIGAFIQLLRSLLQCLVDAVLDRYGL